MSNKTILVILFLSILSIIVKSEIIYIIENDNYIIKEKVNRPFILRKVKPHNHVIDTRYDSNLLLFKKLSINYS